MILRDFFDYPLLPKEIELGRATSIFSTSLIRKSLHNLNICNSPDSPSFPSLYIYVCQSPDIIAVAFSKTTKPSTILCPPNLLNGFSIAIAESARGAIHCRFRSYIEPYRRLVCPSDFIEPICSRGFLPRCPNIFDDKEEEASWWQEAAQSPAIFRSTTGAYGRWGYDFRRQAEPRRCCC